MEAAQAGRCRSATRAEQGLDDGCFGDRMGSPLAGALVDRAACTLDISTLASPAVGPPRCGFRECALTAVLPSLNFAHSFQTLQTYKGLCANEQLQIAILAGFMTLLTPRISLQQVG